MPNFKENSSSAMRKSAYKMKGNPMQRNFGIPLKNTGDHKHTDETKTEHPMSQAMKDKIAETSKENLIEVNKALVATGKPEMTADEYNKSTGRTEGTGASIEKT